jgi:hypothetical protein
MKVANLLFKLSNRPLEFLNENARCTSGSERMDKGAEKLELVILPRLETGPERLALLPMVCEN